MRRTTSARRAVRVLVAGLGAALVLTGCGFGAQTLQPYTPSFGTNVDAPGVKVRNLLVVAQPNGDGVVSGSILAAEDDRLTDMTAVPLLADNSDGEPLSIRGDRVTLPANQLVVLSDQENPIVLSGDLGTDTNVRVTLVFDSGVTAEVVAPVVSSENPVFATVTPAPTSTQASSQTPGAAKTTGAQTTAPATATPTP